MSSMHSNQIQIWRDFVENLEESDLAFEERKIVYECLLDTFEEYEINEVESLIEQDKAFEQTYNERYPQMTEREDDDEEDWD